MTAALVFMTQLLTRRTVGDEPIVLCPGSPVQALQEISGIAFPVSSVRRGRYGRPVPLRVTSLHRYPVKSCRGETLRSADVERWGLAGDRRWMVVDPAGSVISAREAHR